MSKHQIGLGECISSLADKEGFGADAIWQHPGNAVLRGKRGDPNVLAKGDVVTVPERQPTMHEIEAGGRCTFVIPTHVNLRVRLQADGEALANEPYSLHVNASEIVGETTDDGLMEERIPASAMRATLVLANRGESFELELGRLAPATSSSGAAARLHNLGLLHEQGARQAVVADALATFQADAGIEVTGKLDPATTAALQEQHGG